MTTLQVILLGAFLAAVTTVALLAIWWLARLRKVRATVALGAALVGICSGALVAGANWKNGISGWHGLWASLNAVKQNDPAKPIGDGAKEKPTTANEAAVSLTKEVQAPRQAKSVNAGDDFVYFDPGTGAARVWYYKNEDGWIFLYDCDCFHPVSGKRLLPVTPEVVDKHKAQNLLALAGFKKLESDRINEAVGRCVSEAEKNYDKTFVVTVPIKAIYKKDSASFVIMLGGKMARISNRVGVVLDRSALEAAGVWMLWELYHNQYELGVRSEAVVGHRYNDVHGIRILSIPSTIGRFGSYQLGIKLNDNDPTSWFDTASWPARTKIQRCQTVFFYVQT